MSNTPRTDEQAGALIDAEEVVPADFARELEIELNEQVLLNGKGSEREYILLGKIERLERENAALKSECENRLNGYVESRHRLNAFEKEVNALREEVINLKAAIDAERKVQP